MESTKLTAESTSGMPTRSFIVTGLPRKSGELDRCGKQEREDGLCLDGAYPPDVYKMPQ